MDCFIAKEFTGESCNKQVPCTEFKCQNKGHCVSENGNTSFVCKCPPGWDGPFCSKGMVHNVIWNINQIFEFELNGMTVIRVPKICYVYRI